MRLINRLAHCVLDRFLASLINRATHGVIDGSLMFLVDRLANGVIDCSRASLVLWHHHCVVDVTSGRFGNEFTALNLAVLVVNFVPRAVSSLFNSVVNCLSHGAHASVCPASHRCGRHFISISGSPASTTALIADRATICSARGICTGHDRADHDGGYDPQPIHLDFSTGNNTSVARRSFGDNGASAHITRHRSPCLFPDALLSKQSPVRRLCLDRSFGFAKRFYTNELVHDALTTSTTDEALNTQRETPRQKRWITLTCWMGGSVSSGYDIQASPVTIMRIASFVGTMHGSP